MAARGTPLRLLQYLVYTNYASILEQSPEETQESVLQYYLKVICKHCTTPDGTFSLLHTTLRKPIILTIYKLSHLDFFQAVTFDSSDNSLWIKIGRIAAKEKKYKLARYALECGLQQSRPDTEDSSESTEHIVAGLSSEYDLTPSQWMCLETLCEVRTMLRVQLRLPETNLLTNKRITSNVI